jgi:hypothetical protein
MAVITQTQKDQTIRDLNYLIGKLEALGLDPKWSTTTMDNEHNDPALAWNVVRTEINAAGVRLAAVFATWVT